MWQKKSFRKKLQIEKRCSTTIQRYVEKKIQNTKKKWKNIDYEIIEISSTDFENEKFHKIDESQNFQNVLNEKKQNSNSTTAQINATINNFDIDKFVF